MTPAQVDARRQGGLFENFGAMSQGWAWSKLVSVSTETFRILRAEVAKHSALQEILQQPKVPIALTEKMFEGP